MSTIPCHRFEAPSDPAAKARAWCEHIAPVFQVEVARDADLTAPIGMTIWHLGEIIVGWVDAPAQRLERSDRLIAQQGLDHVLLQFYERGRARVETPRHSGTVEGAQVVVFDLTQPVSIEAAAVRAINVMIPRALVSDEVGLVESLHGRAFDYDSDPVKRLLHTYLRGLIACGDTLEPVHLHSVAQAASKLCGACFHQQSDVRRVADTDVNLAVRQFIQRELTNTTLGVDVITQRFGLSRATLYRLFDADGGVINYIRDRRLMRAMKLLTQAGGSSRPRVSAVAYATGFADEKTFSRAFKRRFGFLPRDAGTGGARSVSPGPTPVLLSWIKTLAA